MYVHDVSSFLLDCHVFDCVSNIIQVNSEVLVDVVFVRRVGHLGFYVAELLIRLLPLEDAHPELFHASAALLGDLASGERREPLLRLFERALLDELGYGLSLSEDVEGLPIRSDAFYRYHPELGAEFISTDPGGIPGSALLALASGCFPDEADLVWAKRLMRMVLDQHLEGRPLKSRELFQTFSRSRSG